MLSLAGSRPGRLIRLITPLEFANVKVTAGPGSASTDQRVSSDSEQTSELLIHVMWSVATVSSGVGHPGRCPTPSTGVRGPT